MGEEGDEGTGNLPHPSTFIPDNQLFEQESQRVPQDDISTHWWQARVFTTSLPR